MWPSLKITLPVTPYVGNPLRLNIVWFVVFELTVRTGQNKKPCYRWEAARLCLSVVSVNSTIPRTQSFIISYFGFYQRVQINSVLFSLAYASTEINEVDACCYQRTRRSKFVHDTRHSPVIQSVVHCIISAQILKGIMWRKQCPFRGQNNLVLANVYQL